MKIKKLSHCCMIVDVNDRRILIDPGLDAEAIDAALMAKNQIPVAIVCTHGHCSILLDDGSNKETTTLDRPDKGLYIGAMLWREMYDFSPGCVLTVFASEYYKESDYIRSYDRFLDEARSTSPA